MTDRAAQVGVAGFLHTQEVMERNDKDWCEPNYDDIQSAFEAGATWAEQNPNWINVKDALPQPDEKVIALTCTGKMVITSTYQSHGKVDWHGSHFMRDSFTHWLPLPQAPKGGQQ